MKIKIQVGKGEEYSRVILKATFSLAERFSKKFIVSQYELAIVIYLWNLRTGLEIRNIMLGFNLHEGIELDYIVSRYMHNNRSVIMYGSTALGTLWDSRTQSHRS